VGEDVKVILRWRQASFSGRLKWKIAFPGKDHGRKRKKLGKEAHTGAKRRSSRKGDLPSSTLSAGRCTVSGGKTATKGRRLGEKKPLSKKSRRIEHRLARCSIKSLI